MPKKRLRNLKQLKLVIYVFDESSNTVFEYAELQVLTKSPPPHLEELSSDISSKLKGKLLLGYSNYGTQKPFLSELQKLLNGLQ